MAVSTIPNRMISEMTLLWTNSSTTSSFSAQTVSIDLNDYQCVMIIFRQSTSDTFHSSLMVVPAGYDYVASSPLLSGTTIYKRLLTARRTGIQFYSGRSDSTVDESKMIPRFIYGINFHQAFAGDDTYTEQYHIGDIVTYPNNVYVAQGMVGSNAKTISFIINLPKPIGSDITNLTFNTLNVRPLGVSGQIMSGSILTSSYNISAINLLKEQGAIRVSFTKSDDTAWNVTELSPVNIFFTGLSFTFS